MKIGAAGNGCGIISQPLYCVWLRPGLNKALGSAFTICKTKVIVSEVSYACIARESICKISSTIAISAGRVTGYKDVSGLFGTLPHCSPRFQKF